MKTAVKKTSIDAYHSLDLNRQQKDVLSSLRVLGESCIADLAEFMNWQKSTVAARMNELRKLDILVFAGKRKSGTTGITCEFYWAKDNKEGLF